MKNIVFSALLFFSMKGSAQVIADPATNELSISTLDGVPINAAALSSNGSRWLKIPIYNLHQQNALPVGSCKIKIGLGSKLVLDPSFQINSLPATYFSWFINSSGGQVEITGNLIASLPGNYTDTLRLPIIGNVLGNSTITTNFLVTNHNTTTNLSDENPNNNATALPYSVSSILPVTFAQISAKRLACRIHVDFKAVQEINVKQYEIETSTDGTRFFRRGELPANQAINYGYEFAITNAEAGRRIFIRVKSVDHDGKSQYSSIVSANAQCEEATKVVGFPNPLKGQDKLNVLTQGYFNGAYRLSLYNISGGLLNEQLRQFNQSKQFSYTTGAISAGQYILTLLNLTTQEKHVIYFEKR